MTYDPLEALLRLREAAADKASRDLAECLRLASEAAAAVAAIEAVIAYRTELATRVTGGDEEVEAFAAWLRRVRPRLQAAHAAELDGELATACARAALAAAKAAVREAEETRSRRLQSRNRD